MRRDAFGLGPPLPHRMQHPQGGAKRKLKVCICVWKKKKTDTLVILF